MEKIEKQATQKQKRRPWLRNVDNVYLGTLFQTYVFLKGGVGSICLYGALPLFYFKHGLDTSTYQTFLTLAFLPWAGKALVAAMSDTYPVLGWNKRWYIVGAIVLLTTALFGVGMSKTAIAGLVFLMLCSLCIVVIDTLYEGISATLVAFYGADNKVVSYMWGFTMFGTLIGAAVVGPLGDYKNGAYINYAFIGAMLLSFQAIVPVLLYPGRALPHDVVHKDPSMAEPLLSMQDSTDSSLQAYVPQSLRGQPPSKMEWCLVVWLTIAAMMLVVILGATTGTSTDLKSAIVISALCPIIIGVLMWLVYHNYNKRPVYLGTCVFLFLHEMLCVNIQAALDGYYTAPDNCVLDGPGFNLRFYTTAINFISAAVGMGAVVLYNRVFSSWTVRGTMQVAILMRMFSSLFDLAIAMRWNKTYLGISDEVFFLFGGAIVDPTASMLVTVASSVLVSNTVYHGRATTTYAVLLSFQYLGQSMSRILGLAITSYMGVRANRYTGCNFDNYPDLIVFTELVSPFLAICIAYLLVPNIAFDAKPSQRNKAKCCGLIPATTEEIPLKQD